jgi:hypothetical protein
MNIVMGVLLYGTAEILVRGLSEIRTGTVHHIDEAHHFEERLLGRTLYPVNWSRFAGSMQRVINRMDHERNFLIADTVLGWTNGNSRKDKTHRYFSSVEGLRSPHEEISFSNSRMRHSVRSEQPASVRIALLGDSFTFGDEVLCEESWGHIVETLLEPQTQVLNFGVNAYGLNQAFLRYQKDVRAWKPQIVILGLMSDMVLRSINIYPFLQDPHWGTFPFSRPKLVMDHGRLAAVNQPIPAAASIFALKKVNDLPFLHLDEYYRPYLWDRGGLWSFLEKSYFFRFAYSFRLPPDDREQERTDKALQISQLVVQQLAQEIVKNDAVPVIVYLPTRNELYGPTGPSDSSIPLAVRVLQRAKMNYVDPSPCLLQVNSSEAFLAGAHYSPQANRAVAHCVEPVLRKLISRGSRPSS